MSNLQQQMSNPNPCAGGSDCQCPPGSYYVSAVDGPESWLMAGPYPSHHAAESDRNKALTIADQQDGRAWFMSWGVTRMADDYQKPGVLNSHGLI